MNVMMDKKTKASPATSGKKPAPGTPESLAPYFIALTENVTPTPIQNRLLIKSRNFMVVPNRKFSETRFLSDVMPAHADLPVGRADWLNLGLTEISHGSASHLLVSSGEILDYPESMLKCIQHKVQNRSLEECEEILFFNNTQFGDEGLIFSVHGHQLLIKLLTRLIEFGHAVFFD